MLNVFVCKSLAARTLRQAHALAQGAVIGFGVARVQRAYGEAAFDTNRHLGFTSWAHAVDCWDAEWIDYVEEGLCEGEVGGGGLCV